MKNKHEQVRKRKALERQKSAQEIHELKVKMERMKKRIKKNIGY